MKFNENFELNIKLIREAVMQKYGAFSDKTEELLEGENGFNNIINAAFNFKQ